MARPEKTEPLAVCVDADVLIAGLLSRTGASHAILVLGELGLLRLVLPEATVAEIRRNLAAKLPEAAPLFEEFLRAVPVQIHRPTANDYDRARELADAKDVPIIAAAVGAGARLLVTHNIRHFRSGEGVRVLGPEPLSRRLAVDELARDVRSAPGRSPEGGVAEHKRRHPSSGLVVGYGRGGVRDGLAPGGPDDVRALPPGQPSRREIL